MMKKNIKNQEKGNWWYVIHIIEKVRFFDMDYFQASVNFKAIYIY